MPIFCRDIFTKTLCLCVVNMLSSAINLTLKSAVAWNQRGDFVVVLGRELLINRVLL